jgi:enamine deaminase RidA (YjgF/YER057c/UK114 family)
MERELINPEGVFAHPAYTGVVTVTDPRKFHFIAGRTPADPVDYSCVAPGDFRAQYRHVMKTLDIELKAIGATWADVVYRRIFTLDVDAFLAQQQDDPEIQAYWEPGKVPPGTLIGVTRLSDPEFLIEIDLLAITE